MRLVTSEAVNGGKVVTGGLAACNSGNEPLAGVTSLADLIAIRRQPVAVGVFTGPVPGVGKLCQDSLARSTTVGVALKAAYPTPISNSFHVSGDLAFAPCKK
jgi:hypothetical protein